MQPALHPEFREVFVQSTLDGSREPSLLYLPKPQAAALVVGLHTWSMDRFNQQEAMLPFCQSRNWALLLPEFRGSNTVNNPRAREACGSALARRDILDATRHVVENDFTSPPPTFLLGGSGGGHMSLMMGGAESYQWTAISSWCPITDLKVWHGQNAGYMPGIAAVCGGRPGESAAVDEEYRSRSPLQYAETLARTRLQLGHGRFDKSVPYSHSWLMAEAIERHQPKEFYFSIFDGGHELLYDQAFAFFDRCMCLSSQEVSLTG